MNHDPLVDPGWNAHLRARGLVGKPADPDSVPPTPLPLIVGWRFAWAYVIAPGAALGFIVILGLIIYYDVHPPDLSLTPLRVVAVIEAIALIAVFFIARHRPKWPDHNDHHDLRDTYNRYLQLVATGAAITMFLTQGTTCLAALSSRPFVWMAANVLWVLVMIAIAPTRGRVQRHIEDAEAHGLDLRAVLFLPPPPDAA